MTTETYVNEQVRSANVSEETNANVEVEKVEPKKRKKKEGK